VNCKFIKTQYVSARMGVPLLICDRAGCANHHFGKYPERARATCRVPIVGAGDIAEKVIAVATLGIAGKVMAFAARKGWRCKCQQRKVKLNVRWHWALPNWFVRWRGRAAPDPIDRPEIFAMIRVVDPESRSNKGTAKGRTAPPTTRNPSRATGA